MATKRSEEKIDVSGEDSFPASDPPASSGIVGPRRATPPKRKESDPHEHNDDDAKPTGTPTSDRHATETAYHREDAGPPGKH